MSINALSKQDAYGASGACRHHLVSPPLRTRDVSCLTRPRPRSFATVGMFSAVSNLGAGGLSDITLSDTSNGVLYGTFAITGLFSGGISNCA